MKKKAEKNVWAVIEKTKIRPKGKKNAALPFYQNCWVLIYGGSTKEHDSGTGELERRRLERVAELLNGKDLAPLTATCCADAANPRAEMKRLAKLL